jgi:hypothetical protein
MFLKFAALSTELGPLNAVYWSFNRAFMELKAPCRLFRYYFVAQPVAAEPILPARRGRAIEIRQLKSTDAVLADLPIGDAVVQCRFDQDAVCFGAFQDNAIVGCLWLCHGKYEEDEVRCLFKLDPENSTAWDFGIYVVPAARGGFAFLKLWDGANAYLREQGVNWSLSRISAFNPDSLRSHQNLGTRRIASALFVQLGRLQLMVSSLRPFVHLSASPSQTPELTLSTRTIDQLE